MEENKHSILRRFLSIRGMGQVISVTVALIIMVIIFGIINPLFFSGNNSANLLRQVAPILIIGIGQSFVLITGGIDLSIGSVAGMSCMMSATLMTAGRLSPIPAILITLLCCCGIGLINGILISKAKLPAFIATLGTMIIARGIAQLVNGNMNTDSINSEIFRDIFYYGSFLGIYNPIWIAIILFLVFAVILAKTRTGRHTYAIGSNYEAAKLSGVNAVLAQTKVYVFSAFLACVVGFILTAQSGMGSMDAGNGYELNAVAASVIGGVSTMGGQGMLFGTVIGAFIWGVLNNGLQFAGAPLAFRNLVIGVVVIISVLIDRVARGNLRGKKLFGTKK
ncbi:MAG: permease component of ribose/xylose/arabinose/galactoside ABC-type transporter [Herbinix sp.]|jgi:ribose transport system permease protein|nr:permease component of ribose/xylose/arabinose/galactoside ABC-type transporter [Herbinix sp.]